MFSTMSNALDLIKYCENGFAQLMKCLEKEGWPSACGDKGRITLFRYVLDYVS